MTRAQLYRSGQAARDAAALYDAVLADWPVSHRRHRIATCQGETFVIECGADQGPPLVLLHGSLGNSASWFPDVPPLAAGHHVFAVDTIGEPGFSAPARPPLESDAYAAWLDDVLDGLGLPAATFIGISLGGWMSLDYAIRRTPRVSRLVLIAPGGVGPQRNILYWALPLSLLGAWGRARVRNRILGEPPAEQSDTEQRFGALLTLLAREFRPRYDQLPIFTDDQLSALPMPVLAVVPGKDVMLAPGPMKQRLEANVSRLEMRYLPQARHYPGSQAAPILEFLERTGTAATPIG